MARYEGGGSGGGPPATPTLAQVLAAGNTTGSTPIIIEHSGGLGSSIQSVPGDDEILIQGAASTGGGPGQVRVQGGDGTAGPFAGLAILQGGSSAGAFDAGIARVLGGTNTGANNAGNVEIQGGVASTGLGGDVVIAGGSGGSTVGGVKLVSATNADVMIDVTGIGDLNIQASQSLGGAHGVMRLRTSIGPGGETIEIRDAGGTPQLRFYGGGPAVGKPIVNSLASLYTGLNATGLIDASGAGPELASQVNNDSTVTGVTVKDALNTLLGAAGCAKSGTVTSGLFACAENLNTTASGANSHAEGNGTESRGANSHSEGQNGLAQGISSHVEGTGCTTGAAGDNGHAEGSNTHANGLQSHAEGQNSTANGRASHAEGLSANSAGVAAHAEGSNCSAVGSSAHAEGLTTTANADGSHSEGNACVALGTASHAECFQSVATGNNSSATGGQSNAWLDSDFAHAGGAFGAAGDAQYRRSVVKGSTPGALPGESVALQLGILQAPITLRPSTVYGVTVRATATVMGLGAAARQAAYYHLEFLVAVTSAGNVTVSAVTAVVAPIIIGAGFVGATLVPSGVNPNELRLTFNIGGLLTVNSRIVASVEYVEVLGT